MEGISYHMPLLFLSYPDNIALEDIFNKQHQKSRRFRWFQKEAYINKPLALLGTIIDKTSF